MTEILKPPKSTPTPKPKTESGAKKEPLKWPFVFELQEAQKMFAPVEDAVALEAFYVLWRIAVTGKGDPSQVQACKALIEQRIGRAYSKSPMSGETIDSVEISYHDPYMEEDNES